MMQLDTDRLHDIASSSDSSEDQRRVAKAVYSAMNDWPTPNLELVDDFVFELKRELGALTIQNIKVGAARMNPAAAAWKMEGLSELLEAWTEENQQKTLDELLESLRHANTHG
jgi:hypothetical protein